LSRPNLLTHRSYQFHTLSLFLFFLNHPAPTEIYTLSLHDALPISLRALDVPAMREDRIIALDDVARRLVRRVAGAEGEPGQPRRSEEHTSELQSLAYLVCRLLLEKKKKKKKKENEEK